MNETVNNFLLAGDKLMAKMYLKQPGFIYSDCDPFTKKKQIIEKFVKAGNTNFIYRDNIYKAC